MPGTGTYDYATKTTKLGAGPRIDVVKRLDDYVRRRYPDVINTDLVLHELGIEKALVTSEGARSYCLSPRVQLWLQLSVRGADGPVQLYGIFGNFGEFEDQFEELAACEPAIDGLYEDLRRKAEGVYCEAGMHDVVLDSDVAGILAHEAIGHTCEADLVLAGSVAANWLGR